MDINNKIFAIVKDDLDMMKECTEALNVYDSKNDGDKIAAGKELLVINLAGKKYIDYLETAVAEDSETIEEQAKKIEQLAKINEELQSNFKVSEEPLKGLEKYLSIQTITTHHDCYGTDHVFSLNARKEIVEKRLKKYLKRTENK